ncbi:MAG: type II toxin-antitoxin system VapC family toxin, partial [Bacillota bacterium]
NKEAACMAANIERGLRQQGMVIGTRDVFIAGTCLAHGLTIVTGNIEHFSRVPGLEVISPAALV